jgi:hypothetical protein
MESSSTSCHGSGEEGQSELNGAEDQTRTLEGHMEEYAAYSDQKISTEGDQEYLLVSFLESVVDAFSTQVHEKAVCQGIDNLSNIWSRIVVLEHVRVVTRQHSIH